MKKKEICQVVERKTKYVKSYLRDTKSYIRKLNHTCIRDSSHGGGTVV